MYERTDKFIKYDIVVSVELKLIIAMIKACIVMFLLLLKDTFKWG